MKICEMWDFVRELNAPGERPGADTVDTLKFGDDGQELTGVATTMFVSAEVLRRAFAAGLNMIIAHETVFHIDSEIIPDDRLLREKKAFLDRSGIAVYRWHDHPHARKADFIDCATIHYSGLKGHVSGKPYWAITQFRLDEPMTAREIVRTLQRNLNCRNIRIAGAPDCPGREIAFACGGPGHNYDLMLDGRIDFLLTGEVYEWHECEYARDQAQLGGGKALLVLGHEVSERSGMRLLAEQLQEKFSAVPIRYIETGDVYSYAD